MRSYDSRKEPPPEFDCKIWEAGRATSAIGLAFKPIKIGQSIFHDNGAGTFNPAPEAIDEAVINEWPGREIGVFVSVGTGKRPKGSDSNQHMWYEDFLGEFAEARRRLIAKIEGCESIHEYMMREHLAKRNVNKENYYRLNVEIGVGEFGMNEWHRLGEISTGTRRYMSRTEEQKMVQGISSKLAKILKAKSRWERALRGEIPDIIRSPASQSFEFPMAVELQGDDGPIHPALRRSPPPSRESFESGRRDSLHTPSNPISPRSSHELPSRPNTSSTPPSLRPPPPPPNNTKPTPRIDDSDKLIVTAPSPDQYQNYSGADKIAIMSPDEHPRPPPVAPSSIPPQRLEPPPLPPKTPLPDAQGGTRRSTGGPRPPYPLDDEAPPPVNMARKPEYRR